MLWLCGEYVALAMVDTADWTYEALATDDSDMFDLIDAESGDESTKKYAIFGLSNEKNAKGDNNVSFRVLPGGKLEPMTPAEIEAEERNTLADNRGYRPWRLVGNTQNLYDIQESNADEDLRKRTQRIKNWNAFKDAINVRQLKKRLSLKCDLDGCIESTLLDTGTHSVDELYNFAESKIAYFKKSDKFHKAPVQDYMRVARFAGNKDFVVDQPDMLALQKGFSVIEHKLPQPSEAEIKDILKQMGKLKPADELNCGSCGYNTCREKAIAIFQGKAEISMCLPYLKDKAESFSDNIVRNTPNALIVLNENLEVQQINRAAPPCSFRRHRVPCRCNRGVVV